MSVVRYAGIAAAFASIVALSQPASAATTLTFFGRVTAPPPGPQVTYTAETARATLECSLGCEGLLSSLVTGVYANGLLPALSTATGFGAQADLFDTSNSSDATELAFVNAWANPDFASGSKGFNNAGASLTFTSSAQFLLFKIGADPNYALIKNTVANNEFKYTAVSGQGAGVSHITSFGNNTSVVPLPASLPLFLAGLAGLGLFGWRRRAA